MLQSEWDYKVAVKELQVHEPDGSLLQTHFSTVDEHSGEILGLVSRRYNLVQNIDLFNIMNEVKDRLGLTHLDTTVVKEKRATIFRYGFDAEGEKIVEHSSTPEDKVKFGFEVFNSFDSRLGGGGFRAYAQRLACLNGLTLPREIGRIQFRNFAAMTSTCIRDTLLAKLDPIMETVGIWNTWAQITPDRTKVGEFITSNLRGKHAETLLESYDNAVDKSVWGLYNVITYYITHEVKSKTPTDIRMKQWDFEKIANKLYKVNLN